MHILFVRAIIISTACVLTSVFPSSYRNTVISQSVRIFALGYFLQRFRLNNQHCVDTVYKKVPVLGWLTCCTSNHLSFRIQRKFRISINVWAPSQIMCTTYNSIRNQLFIPSITTLDWYIFISIQSTSLSIFHRHWLIVGHVLNDSCIDKKISGLTTQMLTECRLTFNWDDNGVSIKHINQHSTTDTHDPLSLGENPFILGYKGRAYKLHNLCIGHN